MKKNFLNDLQSEQEVYVLEGYMLLEDMDKLDTYPFDPILPTYKRDSSLILHSREDTIKFWKKHLEEEFILDKNFHQDLLHRTLNTSLELWATNKQIPNKELIRILEMYQEIEENTIEAEAFYKMKAESPFNEPLIFGVTTEAMANIEKTYKLKDAHSLYTELAKLDVFDFNSLLRFSKHFGMPSGILDDYGFDIFLDGNSLFFPFSSMSVLNKKIAIYKRDFEWFKIIQMQNVSEIRSRLTKSNIDSLSDNQVINLAKEYLASLLGYLDAFNVSMHLDFENGTFVPGVWFKDLFNFAYFQLAKALSNNVEVLECDYCSHIFEVTHKRQRFCPPLPNRKRSSCEMAYNNRLKKEKKQKGDK
jgi:hypothetical protein